mmetsp:Transcript_759/g.1810  ORF Transcript_759/g.1810 Transcript_759/m.1810 type:complete len:199 (-) Transcript_759:203-799(-)
MEGGTEILDVNVERTRMASMDPERILIQLERHLEHIRKRNFQLLKQLAQPRDPSDSSDRIPGLNPKDGTRSLGVSVGHSRVASVDPESTQRQLERHLEVVSEGVNELFLTVVVNLQDIRKSIAKLAKRLGQTDSAGAESKCSFAARVDEIQARTQAEAAAAVRQAGAFRTRPASLAPGLRRTPQPLVGRVQPWFLYVC